MYASLEICGESMQDTVFVAQKQNSPLRYLWEQTQTQIYAFLCSASCQALVQMNFKDAQKDFTSKLFIHEYIQNCTSHKTGNLHTLRSKTLMSILMLQQYSHKTIKVEYKELEVIKMKNKASSWQNSMWICTHNQSTTNPNLVLYQKHYQLKGKLN